MEFRPITNDELAQSYDDLYKILAYNSFVRYATDLYGPNAFRIAYEVNGEYNDEGGTAWSVSSVEVYDADKNDMYYDPTTEWWKNTMATRYYGDEPLLQPDHEDFTDEDRARASELYHEYLDDTFSDTISDARYEIDVENHDILPSSFYVGKPPEVRFPVLYVPVEETT